MFGRNYEGGSLVGELRTNIDSANLDHGTVGLIGNTVDLLDGEGVGEELILRVRADVLVTKVLVRAEKNSCRIVGLGSEIFQG